LVWHSLSREPANGIPVATGMPFYWNGKPVGKYDFKEEIG
jgi:hypothetical protein